MWLLTILARRNHSGSLHKKKEPEAVRWSDAISTFVKKVKYTHPVFRGGILDAMSTITVLDVQKLAQLSALSISDDEAVRLAAQLVDILGYVEQLGEVDTTGLQPTYQVTGLENVTRADEVVDYGLSRDDLLKNAPESEDGAIKVERVLG